MNGCMGGISSRRPDPDNLLEVECVVFAITLTIVVTVKLALQSILTLHAIYQVMSAPPPPPPKRKKNSVPINYIKVLYAVKGVIIFQMVELYRNPSGDVQLATASSNAVRTPSNDQLSSEDSAKIAQLRKTVASLRAEIDEV